MFVKDIDDEVYWNKFLDYKINSEFVSKSEKKVISKFILEKKYKKITSSISEGNYSFSIPKLHIISKENSRKKRQVYSFNDEEMIILKYIAFLLHNYDFLFSDNLFSFRKNLSIKTAVNKIKKITTLNNMYCYKIDIRNYFNSINVDILLNSLKKDIKDKELYTFISNIISNKQYTYNNNLFLGEKGVMAGTPISAFLANYYIREIDEFFLEKQINYFRYSDDIIFFCKTKEEVLKYSNLLKKLLTKYRLEVNEDKEFLFKPGDKIEFLGFSFCDGIIDLSTNTVNKMKSKIRRSGRSIRRWMLKKDVSSDKALKVMIRKYNKKFYGVDDTELSWKWWFFTSINTTESLKLIDKHLQEHLRYLVTGRHNKKNYKLVPYDVLKKIGYKSLVHEYYLFTNMKRNM